MLKFSIVSDSNSILFFVLGCIATLALIVLIFKHRFFRQQKYLPKRVITPFERKMFLRLKEAFPQYHVLAQVAFSALITSEDYKIRQRFNRKVTDFVLLNANLDVIAIIELDDPSHIGKEQEDAQRDAMLHEAGYRVYRFTQIPTLAQLRKTISG